MREGRPTGVNRIAIIAAKHATKGNTTITSNHTDRAEV